MPACVAGHLKLEFELGQKVLQVCEKDVQVELCVVGEIDSALDPSIVFVCVVERVLDLLLSGLYFVQLHLRDGGDGFDHADFRIPLDVREGSLRFDLRLT